MLQSRNVSISYLVIKISLRRVSDVILRAKIYRCWVVATKNCRSVHYLLPPLLFEASIFHISFFIFLSSLPSASEFSYERAWIEALLENEASVGQSIETHAITGISHTVWSIQHNDVFSMCWRFKCQCCWYSRIVWAPLISLR